MRQPLSPAAQLFGDRVRSARIALGLSQESNPSLTTIIRIASVLGIEVSALTDGIGVDDLPPRYDVFTARSFIEARDAHR